MKTLIATLATTVLLASPCLAAGDSDVKMKEEAGRLAVTIGGQPFTTYHFGDAEGRPFVRPYFFPV